MVQVGSDGHRWSYSRDYGSKIARGSWVAKTVPPSYNSYSERSLVGRYHLTQPNVVYSSLTTHLWANCLAKTLDGSGITVMIVHPGAILSVSHWFLHR